MQHFLQLSAIYRSLFLFLLFTSSHAFAQNVGINAPTPLSPLHVRGNDVILTLQEIAANNSGTGAQIAFEGQTGANVPKSAYMGIVPSDNVFPYRNGSLEIRMPDRINFFRSANNVNSSNLAMTIVGSTGNVGIGTAAPNATLHLGNLINNRRLIIWEDANNDHQFYGFGINSNILRYQTPNNLASHIFYAGAGTTASTELMRIQGNGYVGIGVPAPTEKLHVGGNIRLANDGNILGLDQLVGFNDLRLSGDGADGVDFNISANGKFGFNTGIVNNVFFGLRSKPDVDFLMHLADNNGVFRAGLYRTGQFGINIGYNNVTLGVRAIATDLQFFSVENPAGVGLLSVSNDGNVAVQNTLSKGGGSFKIDHPLDPENKYLYHSFVESPDMMNVYNGNITTMQVARPLLKCPSGSMHSTKIFAINLQPLDSLRKPMFYTN